MGAIRDLNDRGIEMIRVGRFSMSTVVIEKHPQVALLAMEGFLIVRAEYNFELQQIDYVALSEHFDESPRGMEAPRYDIRLQEDEAGVTTRVGVVRWPSLK